MFSPRKQEDEFLPGLRREREIPFICQDVSDRILGHSSSLAREKRKFIQGWISYTSKADDTDIIQLLAFLLL